MNSFSVIAIAVLPVILTSCVADQQGAFPSSSATRTIATTLISGVASTDRQTAVSLTDQVTFFDAGSFDKELSKALGQGGSELTVSPAAPFSVNNIPPRLARWFTAITDSGGSVRAQKVKPPEQTADATRGAFPGIGSIFDIILAAYDYLQEAALYAPANRYNALLWVGESGAVDRVAFTRRL